MEIVVSLVLMVVGIYVIVILHELGHAILALPFTKGNVMISIGSVKPIRTHISIGRLKVGFKFGRRFLCGSVRAIDDDLSDLGCLFYALGGPLMSLVIVYAIAIFIRLYPLTEDGLYYNLLTFLRNFAFYQLLFTVIPVTYAVGSYRDMTSDGMKAYQAYKRLRKY